MVFQILFIYIILFFIFIIIIIHIKDFSIRLTFNYFENKTYYSCVQSEIIRIQNMLKTQIDAKNNNIRISTLDEQLLFMEIYTQELISHNILQKNVFNKLDNDELETYENELGENFKATSSLKDLVNEDVEDDDNKNIKNLIPYYYHFAPIIYQNLEYSGMKMINFYFIGNDKNCDKTNINNLYFKYPLEDTNLGIDFSPLNNKIYDYIIDPFIDCNNGYNIQENLLGIMKDNNWYYNIIKDNQDILINFRIFKLMKINQENKRNDFLIIYNKFNLVDKNGKIINFLFSVRISKINSMYPFIIYDEYQDTLNYDFLTIFNFDKEINSLNISNSQNPYNSIYGYYYNIDDSKNIIISTPKFLENMNLYSFQKREEESSSMRFLYNAEISPDNSIMVKYKEIEDIIQNYDVNYYYDVDALYYKLLYFLNQFFLYKQKYPEYLLIENDNSNNNNETLIEEDHPCSISNIDEYYNNIIEKYNYDCIYDYCYFHNCNGLNSLYNNNHLPNCYCLPLFCKDEKTQKNNQFEKTIKEKLDIKENEDFDYSYTSKLHYYKSEMQIPFSNMNYIFDRWSFTFKCFINFDKKSLENNKKYIANIFYQNYIKYDKYIIFLLFIYNDSKLEEIVNNLHLGILNVVGKIALGHFIAMIILSIILFINIYFSCKKLVNKMNHIKNIRKAITNPNILNKESDKEIKEEINKDDNQKLDNLFEDNENNQNINNENVNLIINQVNKENKLEKNNNNNDIDELDELIKLINDNLNKFKIEFNLNEELNDYVNNIKRQYNELILVNKYKNKLLLNEVKEEKIIINNNDDNSMSISSDNSSIIKKNNNNNIKKDDLSVNILSELLSLSNHKFDFSNIKTNFYYKENDDNSLYNLNEIVVNINEFNKNNGNFEITNIEKVKSALEHYSNIIHTYWKNNYDIQKKKDDI